jgi:hypothetical protein
MHYLKQGSTEPKEITLEELLRGVSFGKIDPADMVTGREGDWVQVQESQFFDTTTNENIRLQAALQLLAYHEDRKRDQVSLIENMDEKLKRININVIGVGAILLLALLALVFIFLK